MRRVKRASGTVHMDDLNEALSRLSTTVAEAVGGAYKDNYKTLPPLPYFNGETPKHQGEMEELWILYNCQDFLQMIENAISIGKTGRQKLTHLQRLKNNC